MKTLLETLNTEAPVIVQFRTKKNKLRTMACTRDLKSIPTEQHAGINSPVLNQPGILCVYDLLIKEWRAFRIDSVTSYD
jgi:hypothetical protein